MELRRWTPLTYVAPDRFVDDDGFWADFDLEDWSRNTYEWTPDPWNGLLDFAKRPRETVAEGSVEEWIEGSKYVLSVRRRVRS